MGNVLKLIVSLFMWIVLGVFMIMVLANAMFMDSASVTILALVPLILGLLTTLAMWSPAVFPWVGADRLRAMNGEAQAVVEQAGKRKREQGGGDERLQVLLSLLSDDERADFLQELRRRALEDGVGSDGELPRGAAVSLDELLNSKSRR